MARVDQATRDQRTAAMHPCARRCGRTADYLVTLRRLEPKRKVRVNGVDKVVEPFATEELCEECCRAAVVAPDPPRSVVALAHHAAALKAAAEAEKATACSGRPAEMGEGWGRRR